MIRFHDHLKASLVPIEEVRQFPGNPNNGDVDAIAESMQVNGVYKGVTVQRSSGCIIEGNHRYAALMMLGSDVIPVAYVDVGDEMAKRILTVDNRTTRLGQDDEHLLAQMLKELQRTETGLIGTGYDDQALAQLLEGLETGGFADFPTQPSWSAFQIVIDFTDEDAANEALADIRATYPEARVVEL